MVNLEEGKTRIDQFVALEWAWHLIRRINKDAPNECDIPELMEAMDKIYDKLIQLSLAENVDFAGKNRQVPGGTLDG